MTDLYLPGWPEAIPTGRKTLLDAALAAGAPFPHQCRTGECGTCKCRLESGEVKSLGSVPGTLSADEIAAGWILPCRSVARTDVRLALPGSLGPPLPDLQKLTATLLDLQTVAPDVMRLWLETENPLTFQAGQYVTLQFPGLPKRSYSPANKPGARVLEFFVRLVPDGLVSGHIAHDLMPGDTVRIEGPFGTAFLRDIPDRPVLFAGGGTGLAPCLSMLRHLAAHAGGTTCVVYAGARTAEGLFAEDALEDLRWLMPGLKVVNVLSDAADPRYETGFIGPNIARQHKSLSGWTAFLAGPPPMVDSVKQTVLGLGIAEADIHSDPFTAAAPPSPLTRAIRSLRRLAAPGSARG